MLFRILKIKKLLILQNDLSVKYTHKTFKTTHIQATVSQSSMFSVHYLENFTSKSWYYWSDIKKNVSVLLKKPLI